MDKDEEIRKLKATCSDLEGQVKLLVKTEIKLHRTQAELVKSKEKVEGYSKELEQKVNERTEELNRKIGELERFNKLAVGRELKMIELKKRIQELESKLGNKS